MIEILRLTAAEGRTHLPALAEVLLDCVDGGASVSFMGSLTKAEAESYFEAVFKAVEQGTCILLAAFIGIRLVGTVQLLLATAPNQLHRADIAKLLVLGEARRQGVGACLMDRVQEAARVAGRTLLVLDTATGGQGERLYKRLGWTRAGVIPKYALYPDGTWCDTAIFYKQLV